jgi:hypothetical protein
VAARNLVIGWCMLDDTTCDVGAVSAGSRAVDGAAAGGLTAARVDEAELRRSEALLSGRQTGQSLRVQFFQCVMIWRDDAQWGILHDLPA